MYEDKAWRSGNNSDCALGLRGCTVLRQDTVGKGSDKIYHICDAKSWRNATTYEKDTFGWKDSTDGAIKKGNVTDSIYVFDKIVWRATSNVEAKLGGCVTAIADSVGKVGSTYYICKLNNWVEASVFEYDTYRWGAGKDGEVRAGLVSKTIYYIYETSKNAWRNATTFEKDTYDYMNNSVWMDGIDGEIKKGSVSDTIYVYDATKWRVANKRESVLGGCVPAIQDSMGMVDDYFYICKPRSWKIITETQYDTYFQQCSEFGQIINGSKNEGSVYFCNGEKWRRFYGNKLITYGKLVDERDGQIYRTVQIGSQNWMAENLNYSPQSSPENDAYRSKVDCFKDNCWKYEKYGRYYSWAAAMDSAGIFSSNCVWCGYNPPSRPSGIPSPSKIKRGICPEGWHVPDASEWNALISAVGELNAREKLSSAIGWNDDFNGSDDYGFSIIPAGYVVRKLDSYYDVSYGSEGYYARLWSSDESWLHKSEYALSFGIEQTEEPKFWRLNVRCIQDDDE